MKTLAWLIMVLVLISGLGFTLVDVSCQRPFPWQVGQCRAMEQAILDSTVQIVFHGWLEVENGYEVEKIWGTRSHATVIDGRYLLTHNHFGLPLSQVQIYNQYSNGSLSGISIYRTDGTAVLDHAPLDVFVVKVEEGETVLLDFGTIAGEGFFTQKGFGSALLSQYGNVQLVPGDEVAQIDWDGQGNTLVVWSRIKSVYQDNGLPKAVVDNYIESGASGGGLFLNGQHIGNNWAHLIQTDPNTNIDYPRSVVALNTLIIDTIQN